MAKTRTGSFPIGFRRGRHAWQKNLSDVIGFAVSNGFEALDVEFLAAEEIKPIFAAGLRVGSVDLKRPWSDVASADAGKRTDAITAAAEHIRSVAALGVRNFFAVVFPENDSRDVRENFSLAVEGYSALASAIAGSGARIVMEGSPGSYPYYPALCCTPQSLRLFFQETASDALAINFDPSHLIRMGIDPVRFLEEFAARVGHVHAKDTEIMPEKIYEFGTLQQSATTRVFPFGGHFWRYCIPGHGGAPWGKLLALLKEAGYDGTVSIELEDMNFNGSEEGEKRGLIAGRDFLAGV